MPDNKEFFYSNVADRFDQLMNQYDLEQRIHIVFERLLTTDIRGKKLLELGCGNGWFSRQALQCGAIVCSLDISYNMLQNAKHRFSGIFINASALALPLLESTFDIVISSEMIEHTPDPQQTIREMARMLKPGGVLALTTPNLRWQWLVDLGSKLRWRSFQGIENFCGYSELEQFLVENNLEIQDHFGFHPWPFQIRFLQPLSREVDKKLSHSLWGRWMINQAVCAIKK